MSVKRCLYGPLCRHKLQASYEAVAQATLNKNGSGDATQITWFGKIDICCIYECVYMYTCICRNMFHIEFTLYHMDSNGVAACRLLERPSKTTRLASPSQHRGENPEKTPIDNRCNKRFPSNDLSIVQCHTRNSVWKYPLTASYGQQVRLFTGILLESTTF